MVNGNHAKLNIFIISLCISFIIFLPVSSAQSSKKYIINEWNDFYKGLNKLPSNYKRANRVYRELASYSGMDFNVLVGQTFHWGEAHPGGVIILDVSTLEKPLNILAYKFAHEWAHEAIGHQPNIYNPVGNAWKIRFTPTQDEDEADRYAGEFLAHYGYDLKSVTNYLHSLPVTKEDWQHSNGGQRAKIVKKAYKRIIKKIRRDEEITKCLMLFKDMDKIDPCFDNCENYYPGSDAQGECIQICSDWLDDIIAEGKRYGCEKDDW